MNILRVALALVAFAFVASAIFISILVLERHVAIDSQELGNMNWVVSQAPTELARLQQQVSAFDIRTGEIDASEVKLRFDIVVNRLHAMQGDRVAPFLHSSDRNLTTLAEFERTLSNVEPLLDRIAIPGTPRVILALLDPLYSKLMRMSADANAWNTQQALEDRNAFFSLHWAFASLALGMVICGCGLIVLLLLHNRLLSRTRQSLDLNQKTLALQNARFDAALGSMSVGLCLLDPNLRVVIHNTRFLAIFGCDATTVAPGTPLIDIVGPDLLPGEAGTIATVRSISGDGCPDDITILSNRVHHLPNGRVVMASHEPVADGGWVSTFDDITDRHRAQDRLFYMARHDILTDMPNREYFWERVAQALAGGENAGADWAVLHLDLDQFREVNEALGHRIGDILLRRVAARIRKCAGDGDFVARLGGDGFAVLHSSVGHEVPAPNVLADRLIANIQRPFHIDGHKIVVSTSIGIAAGGVGRNADTLMKNADLALSSAKTAGRGEYCVFTPEMEMQLHYRRTLEADLRNAIEVGQFEVHYQPQVNLATGQIVSAEALVRWRHPERGMISPADFIPLAEETGQISALGSWVLKQACHDVIQWPEHIRVSVNLSPLQFRDSRLVETVKNTIRTSGVEARRIELEITESVLLQNNAANLEALRNLRGLGVSIALDDFGTGYSSLSYLHRFPFDKLKIDQSFVREFEHQPDSLTIVQSIAALGQNLGMRTTVEGVETVEQLAIVSAAGCLEAQGYYFSRPVPEVQFRALVDQQADLRLKVAAA